MPEQQPASPAQSRAFIFYVLLIFWLLSSPDSSGLVSDPDAYTARNARQEIALSLLNTTKWGDFSPASDDTSNGTAPKFLNLTGFRQDDGFAWDNLGYFRDECRRLSDNAKLVREGEDPGDIVVEPIWQQASGIVRGPWVRNELSTSRHPEDYNLTRNAPDVRWIGGQKKTWGRNMTGSEGSIMVKLSDLDNDKDVDLLSPAGEIQMGGKARKIKAVLSIEDSTGAGSTWDMKVHGVHWVREGTIMMTTTSPKYAGIFGLPHLVPKAELFEPSRQLLNQTLHEAVDESIRDSGQPFLSEYSSSTEQDDDTWTSTANCEFLVYLQIHSVRPHRLGVSSVVTGSPGVAAAIEGIENELANPTGAPLPWIPPLQISGVVYSPDCALMLHSKGPPTSSAGRHLIGFKEDIMYSRIKMFFYLIAAIVGAELYLMKKQVQESYTPSTLGRVSFATLIIMGTADGMLFTSITALTLSTGRTFLACLATVFPCLLLAVIECNFLSEVYKTQEPERRRQFQAQQAATGRVSSSAGTAAQPVQDTLPLPATAQRPRTPPPRGPSPPIIVPSDQDIGAETDNNAAGGSRTGTNNGSSGFVDTPFSSIISRSILGGTALIFFSIVASSWWRRVRAAYANIIVFVYLSFWVPQIYRNVMRNCRRALSWQFMVGQSVLRLLPIAYFYLYPTNIILCDTDPTSFTVLAGWVWIQTWVLVFQDVLGPRYLIPASWTPEAWDYHPVLREDNAESGGLPIGLVSAPDSPGLERVKSGEDRDKDKGRQKTSIRVIDCAICCEDIDVPVIRAGEEDSGAGGVAGVLARRQYMVTPCRHIFHSQCLEGWMRFRLQCPICREELPPM